MGALFNPPQAPTLPMPPAPPKLDDPAVANRANEETRQRQMGGRASQFLTNPQDQQTASASQKKMALGANA